MILPIQGDVGAERSGAAAFTNASVCSKGPVTFVTDGCSLLFAMGAPLLPRAPRDRPHREVIAVWVAMGTGLPPFASGVVSSLLHRRTFPSIDARQNAPPISE